jgi:putative addiction module killer protein
MWGPGYRIYFGRVRQRVVLLLLGGDKASQAKDIGRAVAFWRDYLEANTRGKTK